MAHGEPVLYSLYIYAPNKVAPIVFTVLFAISAFLYMWQCYRYSVIKIIGLHTLCAVLFTLGYAFREYGSYNYVYTVDDNMRLIIFILSQVFIYVCPPLLELANYHTLSRLFYYVPYLAPIPPGNVMNIFGGVMAVVELINSLGVAFSSNTSSGPSKQQMGAYLTVAAVCIQLVVISGFVCLAGAFHARCIKSKLPVSSVRTLLLTLYTSMALIFCRSIYRLVGHAGESKQDITNMEALRALSPLYRYEAFFYVFEASLMLINSFLWNIWSPARFLPRGYNIYLGKDGSEVEGKIDPDNRSPLEMTIYVLSFGILCRRKRRNYAADDASGSTQHSETAPEAKLETNKATYSWSPLEMVVCILTWGICCRPKRREDPSQVV